jgi:hypothetical protein
MKYRSFVLAATGAAALGLAACNGGAVSPPHGPGTGTAYTYPTPLPTNPAATTTAYIQIERWGRPAFKDFF